ncbi:MAG TPA: hypothetical protein VFQ58_00215 [Flavisolibacter sp.]|nr:hypothetical protein [Flavisolibacter sp.]
MKKYFLPALLPAISLFFCFKSIAQDKEDNKSSSDKSHFKFGLNYTSDNVYLGRKDSVKVPYLTPSFGYYNKSGFYISGSLSYLPTSGESRIDLFSVEAGYTFSKKKLEGEFAISKDFFSGNSFNVKSEVTGSTTGTLSYNLGFIKPSLGYGISFSNNTDYSLTGGIEHDFSFADDKFTISPAIIFNGSTQNYYSSYYSKRKYAKTRKGKVAAYNITANVFGVDNFKIMDYEFSVPFEYTANKITFNFTPTLAMPVNPNQVDLTISPSGGGSSYSKIITEKLNQFVFWSFEINYKF